MGKQEGKTPLGGWVGNIKMNLGEIVWGGVDWFGLDQDRE
jgi:hypothetical protein